MSAVRLGQKQERGVERRLAAILAADVVGYSRLMGADEAGTLRRLKAHRSDLFEPLIAQHNGRLVKLMGDGVLVEFASVVHAVCCAIDIQRGMMARNATVAAEDRIEFRIGINLGDLIIDADDLYGDGVNVAARLEALAKPGGICVSAKVYDEVRTKLELAFEDLGGVELKNIAEPVRVYRIEERGRAGDQRPPSGSSGSDLNKVPIAVLPFNNMSVDSEQRYFSDGITEDIITELSRFASLDVIARNSTFVYRDKAVDVGTLGKALGAAFLLEGSVRKAGSRIRLTAQLINVGTGKHVWADRYDRDLEDIFAIQDELVHAIVSTLADRLTAAETARSMRKPPDSLVAYDFYLRALDLDRRYDRQSHLKAQQFLEKAVELDPTFARAHALLSAQIWTVAYFEDITNGSYAQAAVEVAQKAVRLDPDDSFCNSMLAVAYLQARQFDQSRHYHELALTLNPHDSFVWSDYAWYLTAVGEFEKAFEFLARRERVEPVPPDWHWSLRGKALYGLEDWHEAIAAFERSATLPPHNNAYLAACYGQIENRRRAQEYWARFTETYPDVHPERVGQIAICKRQVDVDRWTQGLRRAGL